MGEKTRTFCPIEAKGAGFFTIQPSQNKNIVKKGTLLFFYAYFQ